MSRGKVKVRGLALGGMVALLAAACGSSSTPGASSSSPSSLPVVTMGTTDQIVSLDPAGSYDLPSWTVIYNIYQTLVKVEPNSTNIVPDAATCAWQGTAATTYVCTIKPGLKFSNGDPLTAQDVVFSFDRVLKINNSNGPSSLFGPICKAPPGPPNCTPSVSASGNTVTFQLNAPDAVWPYVLTTGAGAIVDQKVFPADALLPDAQVIGSGPYKLTSYTKGQLAEFKPNPNYKGDDILHNSGFIVRYESSDSTLVQDIKTGQVDIAYRELTPTDITALKGQSGLSVVEGTGIEIRYLVFNLKTMPDANDPTKSLAIRQAVAYVINRQQVASQVYDGTVQPLYAIIPVGLQGHTNAFETMYGSSPNVSQAKQVLQAAGVTTPVKMTIWYNTDHYGAASTDEFTDYMRQLNASGLFNVTLQTAPWTAYNPAATKDEYGVFQLGWFPDYPDPDDYTAPFYLGCNGNTPFMNDHYCNQSVDKWIAEEEATTNQTQRNQIFAQLNAQVAKDAPLIPLWQGGQVAVVKSGITGVKSTLDPSYTFRFWLVG